MSYSETVLALAWLVLLGCAETGQDRTTVSLYVAGTDLPDSVLTLGDIPITIQRADLAFGPLYLCAGTNAGDLCDTARLEWLDTVVVNAIDGAPVRAGELNGTTGVVQSWMYDLGISSQFTQEYPFVLEAAETLGGASLQLEATAMIDGISIPFTASVPIAQSDDTELGVPVVRKSQSEVFFRDVGTAEAGMMIRFNAADWVGGLDLRPFLARDACSAEGPAIACDGTVERRCDGATETSSQDCADSNQVCVPGDGCADRVVIQPESQGYRALRNAVVSGVRPTFSWSGAAASP